MAWKRGNCQCGRVSAQRPQTTLTREQREAVGRFLTGIAAANGIIERKEVTALRSAYPRSTLRPTNSTVFSKNSAAPPSNRSKSRAAINPPILERQSPRGRKPRPTPGSSSMRAC